MDETLNDVIAKARHLMDQREYKQCEILLRKAMSDFPDDAVPHNLMGLLYEKKNDHIKAMKHFKAAWALEPSYKPALQNLDNFADMFSNKIFIFGEEELEDPSLKKRGL